MSRRDIGFVFEGVDPSYVLGQVPIAPVGLIDALYFGVPFSILSRSSNKDGNAGMLEGTIPLMSFS